MLADFVHLEHSVERAVPLKHGEYRHGAAYNHGKDILEGLVNVNARVFVGNYVSQLEQSQDSLVAVVGEEFTVLRKSLCINGIPLPDAVYSEGSGGTQDEGQEKLVAPGNLGYQEDGGHGRLHDASHEACHAHKHEVLFGKLQARKAEGTHHHESGKRSYEQGGTESTAHSPAGIGECHADHLGKHHQKYEKRDPPVRMEHPGKRRLPVEVPFSPGQQRAQKIVALTEQRREQQDAYSKAYGTDKPFHPGILQAGNAVFHPERKPRKIERHQPADHPQDKVEGHVRYIEGSNGAGEGSAGTGCEIRHDGGGERADEQGHHAAEAHVEQQYFQREQNAGERGLEDACDCTCRAAPDQHGYFPVTQLEGLAYVAADCGTRIYYGRLGTHRAAQTYGEHTRRQRRPDVMRLDVGFVPGHRQKHFGNPVADIVFDDETDEQERQQHAQGREGKGHPAEPAPVDDGKYERLD